ncbi:hypothetical protein Gohar_024459, partial [Gossypium harknessii]|nr:hypothetical protein [Gossypium harknessii]
MSSYVEAPASLNDALSKGLSPSSDWSARHLDDLHHKVSKVALSTLVDIIPSCRKPIESYMERIFSHVFSRLIDPKELGLPHSYGVKAQGVGNNKDAIGLMLGVTACSKESGRQAFLAASVDVFIEKPLDPKYMVPILKELDE